MVLMAQPTELYIYTVKIKVAVCKADALMVRAGSTM